MEIKFYEEAPFPDEYLAEIYSSVYDRNFDFSYWNWRFKNNPYETDAHIAYIEENGKLVSFYAVSESRFLNYGKIIKCGLMNSAMTRPEYGGRGLFAKLEVVLHSRLLNEKGFGFLFGFANHNAHRIHRKHAGWKDIFIINSFVAKSNNILAKIPVSDKNFRFKIMKSNIGDINLFEDLIYTNSSVCFDRDIKFIAWRFIDNPVNQYYFLKVFEKDQLVGIVIYKNYMDGIDIMEVFHYPQSNSLEVLKNGLFYLAQKSKNISIWSNLHSEEHVFLESFGFEEKNFNTYFGYIPNNNNFKIDSNKIHFRYTDSDVY